MGRATWLPQVLRDAGLKVEEYPGWRTRGFDPFDPVGVIAHHTAGRCPRGSLDYVARNNLAQILLDCNGVYVVVGSGRMNHGGKGSWLGVAGNSRWIGIEAEHPGTHAAPWPQVQLDAYHRGVAAILK
ncbi:MAG: N-acetylmuramoyl-L-alanine amidase, partial [Actinomycetota bacterium]|nr:N-acetylmuramoyl-L-alanine amidase [Actinomycetota bacterium]